MTETVVWVDPDGSAITLTDNTDGINLEWGRTGADMPIIALITDEIPLQPGGRLRDIRTRPRDIDLPIYVQAETSALLRTKIRDLLRRFDPLRGDGILRVTTDSGDVRQLTMRYVEGLQGNESDRLASVGWRKIVLTVRAFDPYWENPTQVVHVIVPGGSTASIPYTVYTYETTIDEPVRGFFSNPFLPFARLNTKTTRLTATTAYKTGAFFPIFPLTLLNSSLFATLSVENGGDVEAWPVWTIEGPGTDISLQNTSTSETLALTGVTLEAGESVQIDTRPYRRSIVQGTTNLFPYLSNTSKLWSLATGTNGVQVQMGGSDTDSRVTLRFTERYLGL